MCNTIKQRVRDDALTKLNAFELNLLDLLVIVWNLKVNSVRIQFANLFLFIKDATVLVCIFIPVYFFTNVAVA